MELKGLGQILNEISTAFPKVTVEFTNSLNS